MQCPYCKVPYSVWPYNSGPAAVPSTLCLCDHFISQFWSARIKLLPSEYRSESVVRVGREVNQTDGQAFPIKLQLICWFSLAERSRRARQACSISMLSSQVCAGAGPVPPPFLLQCPHIHVKDSTLISWSRAAGQMWSAIRTTGSLTCTSLSQAGRMQGC